MKKDNKLVIKYEVIFDKEKFVYDSLSQGEKKVKSLRNDNLLAYLSKKVYDNKGKVLETFFLE